MAQRKQNEKEDPRVYRTRQLLLQAFSDLFSEKGFHAITVQNITERASVNRGTFYTHFTDKSALLEYWLREQFWRCVADPVLLSGPWNLSALRLLIRSVAAWFSQLHELTRSADRSLIPLVAATLQEALYELLWQAFQPIAASGMDQQVALETAAMVMSWAIFGTGFQCFHQWDESTTPLSPEELANQVTGMLIGGLSRALPAFPLD